MGLKSPQVIGLIHERGVMGRETVMRDEEKKALFLITFDSSLSTYLVG